MRLPAQIALAVIALGAGACHGSQDRIATDFYLATLECRDDPTAARKKMKALVDDHGDFEELVAESFEEINRERKKNGGAPLEDELDPCDSRYQSRLFIHLASL